MARDQYEGDGPRLSGPGADLYPAYLRYMEQAGRALFDLLPTDACRAFFLRVHRPLSAELFYACRDRLAAAGGGRLARLEETLAQGFAPEPTPRDRELSSPYLGLTRPS
jgi:hypothetical protein